MALQSPAEQDAVFGDADGWDIYQDHRLNVS